MYDHCLAELLAYVSQEHKDALTLVTVNQTIPLDPSYTSAGHEGKQGPSDQLQAGQNKNNDLERAKELVDLHYMIKEKHRDGNVDEELAHLRTDVNRVLLELRH